MECYEVISIQTTTEGKELLNISIGEGTGDVETITTTNVSDITEWVYISLENEQLPKAVNIY